MTEKTEPVSQISKDQPVAWRTYDHDDGKWFLFETEEQAKEVWPHNNIRQPLYLHPSSSIEGVKVTTGLGWETHSDKAKEVLKANAGLSDLPTDMTYEARLAVSGRGPRAYEWSDKKHRLVYDLCREIERISALSALDVSPKPLEITED